MKPKIIPQEMKPFTNPCLKARIINGTITKEIDPPELTNLILKNEISNKTANPINIALSTISLTENWLFLKTYVSV